MNKILITTAAMILYSTPTIAAGNHTGGHDKFSIGEPGKASKITRTIKVNMRETDGGSMIFKPSGMLIGMSETIKFAITNSGEFEHEFVLDEHKGVMKHKALMEKFPEMEHDDPNSIRLEAGKKCEIIWNFTNRGIFEFACLIPGHYESGMKGFVAVAERTFASEHQHLNDDHGGNY